MSFVPEIAISNQTKPKRNDKETKRNETNPNKYAVVALGFRNTCSAWIGVVPIHSLPTYHRGGSGRPSGPDKPEWAWTGARELCVVGLDAAAAVE